MADFVIVVATMAAIASGATTGTVPDRLATLGFKTYPGLEACENAVAQNTPQPGTRLVCLPVEPPPGTMFSAH